MRAYIVTVRTIAGMHTIEVRATGRADARRKGAWYYPQGFQPVGISAEPVRKKGVDKR